jgi:hypothetical protein
MFIGNDVGDEDPSATRSEEATQSEVKLAFANLMPLILLGSFGNL